MFQGRMLGTAHIVTIAPPRADGGKHIIEARVTGSVTYTEEYEEIEQANARWVSLAHELLEDASLLAGRSERHLAQVTPLPSSD